jgi:hypothetical protein
MKNLIRLFCVFALSCFGASCSTSTPLQKAMQVQAISEAQQPLAGALKAEQRKSNFQSFYESNRTFHYRPGKPFHYNRARASHYTRVR